MLKKIHVFLITIFMIFLILYSGKSNAFDVSISTSKKNYFVKSLIEINVDLVADQNDLSSIEETTIKIIGMDPHNQNYQSVCNLNDLNEGIHQECSGQDNRFVSVFLTREKYGYGYDGYDFDGKIKIDILWRFDDWPSGNYNALFNVKAGGYNYLSNYTFVVKERFGKVAFICRTDDCNYDKEPSFIKFLNENGWTVEGKGYWSWGDEIRNYKLIVCADELRACKIDGSHPAFVAHKSGVPFLEIADQPYVNAGWRFGYTKGYVGLTNNEDLYITFTNPITEGFYGKTDVLIGSKFNIIPDHLLSSYVVDLADSGDSKSSTLFVTEKYAYVGWFNDKNAESLTDVGFILLNRVIGWITYYSEIYDEKPPVVLGYSPTGIVNTRRPEINLITNEKAICKFSLNQIKSYEEMEFEFPFNNPDHKYQFNFDLPNNTYTVYVKCRDMIGNEMNTFSWIFVIDLPTYKEIAFICRTDSCNYGIENSVIKWLESIGWTVEGKGYWSWGDEIRNYKLIVCADELRACKIDGSHPAFVAHKSGVPFLEIADQPYVNAGWRFGYTKGYVGLTKTDNFYVTQNHYVTQNFSGYTNIVSDPLFNVIQDYNLVSHVLDLADSGDSKSSTLFVTEKYAYVGFGKSVPQKLTPSGNLILNRVINWLIIKN